MRGGKFMTYVPGVNVFVSGSGVNWLRELRERNPGKDDEQIVAAALKAYLDKLNAIENSEVRDKSTDEVVTERCDHCKYFDSATEDLGWCADRRKYVFPSKCCGWFVSKQWKNAGDKMLEGGE